MMPDHFFASAEAAAGPLCARGKSIGARVYEAVSASFAAAGLNTNLGIVLLCAPLAAAAERGDAALQTEVAHVLASLNQEDAEEVFAAIKLANPGGLGSAPRYDVRDAATVPLLTAMAEAADRDLIAAQYASNFRDVFLTGLAALEKAHACGLKSPWTTVVVYLTFLSAFPDSHIMRKHGAAAAIETQQQASAMLSLLQTQHEGSFDALLAFDEELKLQRRNPGTSADLTVATLFADRLRNILLRRHNDG
jgi:triphosphoribosyl-dephospho-CoA synthase